MYSLEIITTMLLYRCMYLELLIDNIRISTNGRFSIA